MYKFENQNVEVKANETSQFHGSIPEHLREVGCRRTLTYFVSEDILFRNHEGGNKNKKNDW